MARAVVVPVLALGLVAPAHAAAADFFVGSSTPGAGDAGSTLDDAVADAPGGTAYDGSGRVEDTRLVGATGARLDAARLVRTRVVGTMDGIVARLGTSQLLQVAVLPRDQTPQGGVP